MLGPTSSQLESITPSGSIPAGPSYFLSSEGRSEFHSSFLQISIILLLCSNSKEGPRNGGWCNKLNILQDKGSRILSIYLTSENEKGKVVVLL